jgi:hypothetical protein
MTSLKAQVDALNKIRQWQGNEPDLYPYIKDLFVDVLGYPKENVKINSTQRAGFPDILLNSKESTPQLQIAWVCAEIKRERGLFRDAQARKDALETQLKKYITADSVYALLMDPLTIAIYWPDGREIKVIKLDEVQLSNITDPNDPNSLHLLSYENSISEKSLDGFRNGLTPTGYLSINSQDERERFHEALRVCARELMDYASAKLRDERVQYGKFSQELESLQKQSVSEKTSLRLREAKLKAKYANAVHLVTEILPEFERQVGKQTPTNQVEEMDYVSEVFGTEAASLILSRIIFVRFAEDHSLTTRKISNGGIKVFREFYTYMKDDYRLLLKGAYEDASHIYARLFEESIFDWAHEGNGQLARILERVFYRLNAFNFALITGDILGNVYEAFLDKNRRKKLGEYYTKSPIVKFLLNEMSFPEGAASLIDPACGSGSFLVQALMMSIERMISRSVSPKNAIESTLELIHGLDLNVFASFITQLQILWSIFPYLGSSEKHILPELQIYGGLNSLEYDPQLTLGEAVTAPLEREATLIRDSKYDLVVGNPPYIRNERLKDKGPWRDYYKPVDKRNSDIAFYFVQRALLGGRRKKDGGEDIMPPWLEDKGKLGFVLSIGFANSRAALALRQSMLSFKILQVVDLELVAYRLFDADIVPMLVIIQKEQAPPDWKVKVRVVDPTHKDDKGSIDIFKAPTYQVSQSLLKENDVNPFGYFLTKIRDQDLPILTRLLAIKSTLLDYAEPLQASSGKKEMKKDEVSNAALMFGMKLGSGEKIKQKETKGSYTILKGSDIATFYLDESASEGWVNPDDAESKSIWGHLDEIQDIAYVVPEITITLTCSRFNPKELAFNNSTIVFVPAAKYKDFPWDIYLNSSVVRFIHLLSFRTTILLRKRCTVYPRTLERLPVPEEMMAQGSELDKLAKDLRDLSSRIKNRWGLVDQAIASATKKRLSTFPLDFSTWTGTATGMITLTEIDGKDSLTVVDEEGVRSLLYLHGALDLLKIIKYLLSENEDEESRISPDTLQRLEIPTNYAEIAQMIDNAENPNSTEIVRFRHLIDLADEIIERTFGLSASDRAYIHKRLSEYPLGAFVPRYPWTAGAHHQRTRVYAATARFG